MDYDIAIGVSGAAAKETAVADSKQPAESMPYSNSHEFALWCKTSQTQVDWKVNLHYMQTLFSAGRL